MMTHNRTSQAVDEFLELYDDGFRVHDAQEYAIFRKYRRMEEALEAVKRRLSATTVYPDACRTINAALAFDPLKP